MIRAGQAVRPPAAERLAELFAERASWVTNAPGHDDVDTTVFVMMRTLNLADLVHGTRMFAAGLPAAQSSTWLRCWTRTRFLFGNPANLTQRSRARVVAPAGAFAWLGPCPTAHPPGLSRLLKPVTGMLPELPEIIDLPPSVAAGSDPPVQVPGRYRELRIALRGLTLVDYLVHIHHTLAESVLLGRMTPAEPLRLVHQPEISAETVSAAPGYARVHYAGPDTTSLRLYTWLSHGNR
jgi:hypothetical protein